jgi:tetratricopeptide (TPR) repeat protein
MMVLILIEKWRIFLNFKRWIIGGMMLFSIVLMFTSFERTKVWTNSGTLWSDVIEKYPFVLKENGGKVEVLETGAEVAYKNRGNFYRENGDSTSAMKDYLVLVKARVKDPLIYSNVGNMYALMNQYDSSLQMYTMALERNPNTFDVHLNRGITYIKMLDYPNAFKDFNQALKLRPNDVGTLVNLCAAYLNNKNYQECINTSITLMKVAPQRWEGHFYQGTAFVNQGKFQQGAASLEKAIALNQNDPYIWFNAGIAQQQIGNKEKAENYILKAKSLNYPVSDAILNGL